MEKPTEITLETQNDITIFHIQGDVTAYSESSINEAYGQANTDGVAPKLLLSFQEDVYINSGGIAILIQMLAMTKKNSQAISIVGISDHFKKIFNMVGITKFAQIHNSQDEAIEAMS